MVKLKKAKIIKRIYEEGRETISSAVPKKKSPKNKLKRHRLTAAGASKKTARLTQLEKTINFNSVKNIALRDAISNGVKKQSSLTGPTKKKKRAGEKRAEIYPPTQALEENYELPSHYGTTSLVFMVKDPFWIYAYWEIAQHEFDSLRHTLPPALAQTAKFILRVYEVTLINFNGRNANNYFDIEPGSGTTNWYINLWADNTSWVGELGLRTSQGIFYPLARSNYVHLPRVGPSSRSEQIWMRVDNEKYTPPYITPNTSFLQKTAPSSSAFKLSAGRKNLHLTEEDIRSYYNNLSAPLKDIILSRLSKLYKIKTRRRYTFLLEGDNESERQKIFSAFFPKDYNVKRIRLNSSQELVLLGASENHFF